MATYDLGFLGGGQLARMSIHAAQRMGLNCFSMDPGEITPASQIAPSIVGRLDDPSKIAQVFRSCDRVTLENEFIPAQAIREALRIGGREESALIPALESLATIQDKLVQRRAFMSHSVPSPRAVELSGDGEETKREIGFPMVLKARFGGYDGKGTRYARTAEELESYRELWGDGGWLAEEFVPFTRELAVMVWISEDGSTGAFPTVETVQENHVCSLVFPSGANATGVALSAVKAVGGLGLYGVELFETTDGTFLVNELAPRPHNTGHYTLDWGAVSQFDVHARVCLGLKIPEFPTDVRLDVCMANLLGQEGAGDHRAGLRALALEHPDARLHWYGKAESRPGRKMGHLNVTGPVGGAPSSLKEVAHAARGTFYAAWTGKGAN